MEKRDGVVLLGAFLLLLGTVATSSRAGAAEGASTLTPNELTFLVSKDVGVERWVVSMNLSPSDPGVIVNVTGNVFKSDGSPPSFVVCRPRADSQGTLADPSSTFRFVCDGADACPTSARECARTGWRRIADDVPLASQFFLPSGGLAAAARERAPRGLLAGLAPAVDRLRAWSRRLAPWAGLALLAPRAADAQANDRGATLSFDGLSYLVNKDIANERWSIGLNFLPVRTAEGGVVNQIEGITGNVLRGDAAPTFIFCTVRGDSTGTLDDPASTFRLSCLGADGCTTTAEECARSSWTTIADDVPIAASFFLPPGGLPATPQSDPDIVVIGRTSDPPSYETTDYTTASPATAAAPAGGACDVGGACFATRIGSCTEVEGVLVESGGTCRCRIDDVDPACITCGGGATGQCGGDCAFPLGDATVRGLCLPASSSSTDCVCYGIEAGGTLALETCGGPLAGQCPEGRCCTDDPTDGCTADATAGCAGICVAGSCENAGDGCGTCFVIGSLPTPGPTGVPTPGPSDTPSPTRTPSATVTPRPTSGATTTPAATGTPAPTASGTPAPTNATATPKPSQTASPTATPQPTGTLAPGCNNGQLDPGEECDVGLNSCGGERCSRVTCQCFSCSPQTLSGEVGEDSTESFDLGISVGTFEFTYNAFQSDADRFIVRYDGKVLFDSGCGIYGTTAFLTLNGEGGSEIEVEVDGACSGPPTGSWEYVVGCPE